MSTQELLKPILDDGIRSVNFFNGRLLSAEDLSREQNANREARQRLGRAVGEGVANGLEITRNTVASTASAPVVTIAPGLAVNRKGQPLELARPVDLALVRPSDAANGATTSATFHDCEGLQTGVYIAGAGLYLLTIAPVETGEGLAPVSGLGNGTATCNVRYRVESVHFRLVAIDPARDLGLTSSELGDAPRLRNRVAHACCGTQLRRDFVANPFGPPPNFTEPLDTLRPNRLTDCDVPLALLYVTADAGLSFIDMWAVRRRLNLASHGPALSITFSDQRLSQAEATFLQFRAQLEEIRANEPNLEALVATQRFAYLPAVGLLPLRSTQSLSGFDYQTFFGGLTYREPTVIEGARFERLIRESLSYPPHDLSSRELIWLYRVRENTPLAGSTAAPQPYLIFASGHMPFAGEAIYDVARFGYSRYATAAVHPQ